MIIIRQLFFICVSSFIAYFSVQFPRLVYQLGVFFYILGFIFLVFSMLSVGRVKGSFFSEFISRFCWSPVSGKNPRWKFIKVSFFFPNLFSVGPRFLGIVPVENFIKGPFSPNLFPVCPRFPEIGWGEGVGIFLECASDAVPLVCPPGFIFREFFPRG